MMNLLKKLAACGLSLTMILSLAACGGTDDASSGESGGEPVKYLITITSKIISGQQEISLYYGIPESLTYILKVTKVIRLMKVR